MSLSLLRCCLLCQFCFGLALAALCGQPLRGNPVDSLASQVRQGNKKALRDLGALLDDAASGPAARQLLERHTLFSPAEWDWAKASREAFLSFYYEHSEHLHYSRVFGAFYLSPPAEQAVRYELEALPPGTEAPSERYRQWVADYLAAPDEKTRAALLRAIAALPLAQAPTFVLGELERRYLGKTAVAPDPGVLGVFRHMQRGEALDLLIRLAERWPALSEKGLLEAAYLSNVMAGDWARYRHLADSLASLEALRQYGFAQAIGPALSFFQYPVDYYGYVLCESMGRPWLTHNALRELELGRHPRSLYYLAAFLFRQGWPFDEGGEAARAALERLSGHRLLLPDGQGRMSSDWADASVRANALRYWGQYCPDYEWQPHLGQFQNRSLAEQEQNRYELAYQRLSASKDSIAMAAYRSLVEGEPALVLPILEKYQYATQGFNPRLPNARYAFLPQLLGFAHFCKQKQLPLRASPALAAGLDSLLLPLPPEARVALENRIVGQCSLAELTAIEYFALLHSADGEAAFSFSRIIDKGYARHWPALLASAEELRVYCKKSALLAGIGVPGTCNHYSQRLGAFVPQIRPQIETLLALEADEDIRWQLEGLLNAEGESAGLAWPVFLAQPEDYDSRDLLFLAQPSLKDVQQALRRLRKAEGGAPLVLAALEAQPLREALPDYAALLREPSSAPAGITLIEALLGPGPGEDPSAFWQACYAADRSTRTWPRRLAEAQLAALEAAGPLDVEALNHALGLLADSPDLLPRALALLPRLEPSSDWRLLQSPLPLRVSAHLPYFLPLPIEARDLPSLPALFAIDDTLALWAGIQHWAAAYDWAEQGQCYNALMAQGWLQRWLAKGADLSVLEHLYAALTRYYDDSPFLSAYDERLVARHLFLLNYGHLSVAEQLRLSAEQGLEGEALAELQRHLLSQAGYGELGAVMGEYALLEASGGPAMFDFLMRDFGIYLPRPTAAEAAEFVALHGRLSPLDLYVHYLEAHGVRVRRADGSLDLAEIAAILRYDAVFPFASEAGGYRDYYNYAVIKVLECHFGSSLGFHPKLNENQDFYAFTSYKRSRAWLQWLAEQGHIPALGSSAPPSLSSDFTQE